MLARMHQLPPFEGLPHYAALMELKARRQWVAWKYVEKDDGRITKPPVNPHNGYGASHSDPATWGSYEQALERAQTFNLAGVGFVLTESDDYTGFDLDDCRDPDFGGLEPWADAIINLGETYAEVSPSGRGIRIIARGKISSAIKCDPASVEVYGKQRYLTITGQHVPGTPYDIRPAPRTLEALQARVAGFKSALETAVPLDTPARKPGGTISSALAQSTERGSFFKTVNATALSNLNRWVPDLFGGMAEFQNGTGAWRVSSKNLGRNLEEDLSIAPNGIVDFGVHDMGDPRLGKRTAIDLVLEYGSRGTAVEAAQWLCERLGSAPEALGWKTAAAQTGGFEAAVSSPTADPADIFDTLTIAEVDALPPPTWLVDGLIPEHGLTFVYGKPGRGKSFITLDLALRIAHGLDWHGRECRQGGVLYIAGEGKGGYRNRVRGWHQHHGIAVDSPADFRLLPRALNFMTPDDVGKLVRTIKAVVGTARLVIIDTVARVLPGAEENASKEMGLFVAACDAIREACGVAVIGVHHSGKDEDRGMRGSSALEGAGDCVLHAKRDEDSSVITLVTEKQKDGEEAKPLYLVLKKIEWMDDLKQASTLVPEVAQEPPAGSKITKAFCRSALSEVRTAWDAGTPWSNAPQTKSEGRYLPNWIARETGCGVKEAEELVNDWLMNGVLRADQYSAKTKAKGLRVTGSID